MGPRTSARTTKMPRTSATTTSSSLTIVLRPSQKRMSRPNGVLGATLELRRGGAAHEDASEVMPSSSDRGWPREGPITPPSAGVGGAAAGRLGAKGPVKAAARL